MTAFQESMKRRDVQSAESAFTKRCFAPTPVKERCRVSTKQLLKERCRIGIITIKDYIRLLNNA